MTDSNSALSKEFRSLCIPNILSNLVVPLAGMIDLGLLGHLDDTGPISGVVLGTLIFDFLYWSFGFLRMGTTSHTAQAWGAKDEREVSNTLKRGLILATALGLFMLAAQNGIEYLGLTLLAGDQEILGYAAAYFGARIWGAPATLGNYVLTGWFLGTHQAKKALRLSILLNGANIGLSWLFIFSFGWGASGAGLATALSSWLAFAVGLALTGETGSLLGSRWGAALSGAKLKGMLLLNFNLLIRTFFLISVFSVFTNMGQQFGRPILVGNSLLLKILTFAAWFLDGFAFALESMAGKYLGAKENEKITTSLQLALKWSMIFALVIGISFWVMAPGILGILTNHQDLIAAALPFVPYLVLCIIFGAVSYTFDGLFIGLGDGALLRNNLVFATLLGFCPLGFSAWYFHNPDLLWLSLVIFMVVRGGFMLWIAGTRGYLRHRSGL